MRPLVSPFDIALVNQRLSSATEPALKFPRCACIHKVLPCNLQYNVIIEGAFVRLPTFCDAYGLSLNLLDFLFCWFCSWCAHYDLQFFERQAFRLCSFLRFLVTVWTPPRQSVSVPPFAKCCFRSSPRMRARALSVALFDAVDGLLIWTTSVVDFYMVM